MLCGVPQFSVLMIRRTPMCCRGGPSLRVLTFPVLPTQPRIAELTRLELLRRHYPRVANAVVDVNPMGSSGLGENSPQWARKSLCMLLLDRQDVRMWFLQLHSTAREYIWFGDLTHYDQLS
jgi:hypothetical protein